MSIHTQDTLVFILKNNVVDFVTGKPIIHMLSQSMANQYNLKIGRTHTKW